MCGGLALALRVPYFNRFLLASVWTTAIAGWRVLCSFCVKFAATAVACLMKPMETSKITYAFVYLLPDGGKEWCQRGNTAFVNVKVQRSPLAVKK